MSGPTGDGRSAKRPWLAAVLAVIYPGLGHLYLRKWIRALLWFGLIISTSTVLLPEGAIPSTVSLESLVAATAAIPFRVSLAIFTVTLLSVADAYWIATRDRRRASAAETGTCPNCGKELDEDIDFCPWCTTRLDEPVDGDAA